MTIAASDRNEVEVTQVKSITHGMYTVSWAPASDDASFEAEHAEVLGQYLAQAVRTREPLHVRLAYAEEDCPASTGNADLHIRLFPDDGRAVVHELVLPGRPEAHIVTLGLRWDDAQPRIARLLKAYLVERCQRDTFASWVRELPTSVVRARLGLPNAVPETTSGASHTA